MARPDPRTPRSPRRRLSLCGRPSSPPRCEAQRPPFSRGSLPTSQQSGPRALGAAAKTRLQRVECGPEGPATRRSGPGWAGRLDSRWLAQGVRPVSLCVCVRLYLSVSFSPSLSAPLSLGLCGSPRLYLSVAVSTSVSPRGPSHGCPRNRACHVETTRAGVPREAGTAMWPPGWEPQDSQRPAEPTWGVVGVPRKSPPSQSHGTRPRTQHLTRSSPACMWPLQS